MENEKNETMLNKISRSSNEINHFYPDLTEYESLKLAVEFEKIDKLDNIYIGLTEIIDSIDSKECSDYSDITICLDQIEKSLDYMTEIIINKVINE